MKRHSDEAWEIASDHGHSARETHDLAAAIDELVNKKVAKAWARASTESVVHISNAALEFATADGDSSDLIDEALKKYPHAPAAEVASYVSRRAEEEYNLRLTASRIADLRDKIEKKMDDASMARARADTVIEVSGTDDAPDADIDFPSLIVEAMKKFPDASANELTSYIFTRVQAEYDVLCSSQRVCQIREDIKRRLENSVATEAEACAGTEKTGKLRAVAEVPTGELRWCLDGTDGNDTYVKTLQQAFRTRTDPTPIWRDVETAYVEAE